MYHIVFNANDDYIKYLAVLCHSIVKNAAHNNIIETMGGGGQTLIRSHSINKLL
ncbi:MAG: hypothetical protein PUG77_08415 [Helicobacter bilis]|uniref:hypothetical protein n=1 Tax=Helicobacter bilis TaxID=37372 RepID=UPI0026E95D99|nr:hypothetical protein [Helicobacter bilis]MDD7297283.1 hypothetical protein [Helicobacter bilis]